METLIAVLLCPMEQASEGLLYTMCAEWLGWFIDRCYKFTFALCGDDIAKSIKVEACVS